MKVFKVFVFSGYVYTSKKGCISVIAVAVLQKVR